jgi:G3E family GTPase
MAKSLVIINEFGSVGLDHDLVTQSDEDDLVVQMSSGCLCCTIKGDLQKTLAEAPTRFSHNGRPVFERVIIETTGLADPAPVIHTIASGEGLVTQYRLAEIITLVDAVNGMDTLTQQSEAVKQAAVADTLIVSKTDLADEARINDLVARLQSLNPGATIHQCHPDRVDPVSMIGGALFLPSMKTDQVKKWLNEEAYRDQHHHHSHDHHGHDHHSHDHGHHHHGHDHDHHHDVNRHDDRIRSVCLTLDDPIPADVFDEWLSLLTSLNGSQLLRVKGLLNIETLDKPMVIHGVQHIWHQPAILEAWPSSDQRSRIVFITRDLNEEDLRKSLKFVLDRSSVSQLDGMAI